MVNLKDIKVNIKVDTTDIPMSDEVKNEWVNDPLDKMLDKWLSSGPSEMRLINLEDKHMRILKGWTKEERKELEEAKDTENIGDFLHVITRYPEDTNYGYVWSNYHIASSREQFSIIEDILDFYTGKAKFSEQKYYIKMPKVRYPYLFKDVDGTLDWGNDFGVLARKYFTEDEIKEIDPRYMAFAVPVEDDDE